MFPIYKDFRGFVSPRRSFWFMGIMKLSVRTMYAYENAARLLGKSCSDMVYRVRIWDINCTVTRTLVHLVLRHEDAALLLHLRTYLRWDDYWSQPKFGFSSDLCANGTGITMIAKNRAVGWWVWDRSVPKGLNSEIIVDGNLNNGKLQSFNHQKALIKSIRINKCSFAYRKPHSYMGSWTI